MRMSFSVGVRRYGEDCFLAQALQPPFLSSAGASAGEALAQLEQALLDALERSHPSRVIGWFQHQRWEIQREELDVHRVVGLFDDPFDETEEESDWAKQPISIASSRSHPGEQRGLLSWFALETGMLARGQSEEDVEKTLTALMRQSNGTTYHHRPPCDEAWLETIDVDFQPLDLLRVPHDMIWTDQFDDEILEEEQERLRPATPTLENTAERWSNCSPREAAERGFLPIFARHRRVDEVEELLASKNPTPVVIVGKARVGKTALVRHLAYTRVGRDDGGRRLWFASAPRLCATEAFSSGWQQQCSELFAELETADDILYVGRLVETLDAGKFVGSDYNLAQFLKPLLADRRVRVIAEATPGEWNLIEQRDIGFARTFHVVRLDDPPEPFAFAEIVAPAARRIAEQEEIEITSAAIQRAWNLQQRFAAEGSGVGRTIDFLARVARRASSTYKQVLDDEDLVTSFCDSTGLPQFMLYDERTLDLTQVIATLERRVMGQRQAVERVADVIGITKAGLAPPDRPLGSFLFVGPTGVGKTELARALAQFLFGDEERLVRLDMSEYSHPDAYGRLIGEGHVVQTLEADYTPGGDLTGPVRRQPFCVVLLDEVEKAHSSVFDLLLQVLGEARLTDAHGRTTRFQNTIVIMTSNLGVDSLRPSIGFADEEDLAEGWSAHFRRESERFFRPEFLARIDQFIPFRPLAREVVVKIAHRELENLSKREGIARLDVGFSYEEEVAEWVAAKGWDPQYGARPLKRVIERQISWPLARQLAETQEKLEPQQARSIHLGVERPEGAHIENAELVWKLEIVTSSDNEHASRQSLLELIEHIAALRRRLQNYTYTEMFSDLEWEIENFDISSQAEHFWRNPNAADMASRAEQSRRIVRPALEIAQELGALEDLAHEAYHSRSFDIHDDLRERADELSPAVRNLFMIILRSAFRIPDEIVLVLPTRRANAPWRAQLVRWYSMLAERFGFELETMRSRTAAELNEVEPEALEKDTKLYYKPFSVEKTSQVPSSEVIVLTFKGFAARPLLLGEDGLHRLISSEGNAVADVVVIGEDVSLPIPDSNLLAGAGSPSIARVWNRRTREVSIPYYVSVEFNERDPWEVLAPVIEDVAWMIVESRWD